MGNHQRERYFLLNSAQNYILCWDILKEDLSETVEVSSLKQADYVRQYKAFRVRLRQAREDAGLRQVEAARALGRPQSFVSKCESGERRVDFVELLELASVYKKHLAYFSVE